MKDGLIVRFKLVRATNTCPSVWYTTADVRTGFGKFTVDPNEQYAITMNVF